VFGFILPIFLWSRGLGYWEIGIVLAMYSGVGAFLLPFTLHRAPSAKNMILVQSLLYIPAAVLVPISESWFLIMMIAIMAFGDYASYITWEQLVSHSVMGYENVATTIGLLLTPGQLTTVVAYAIAGLLVDTFGYVAPFWIAGTFFLVYSLGAWSILKNRKATADSPQPF
jgi:MFS family permease